MSVYQSKNLDGMHAAEGMLRLALLKLRGAVIGIATVSGVINLLALTGSLYMLQVYDRVLTSHSVSTLVALSILTAGLFLFLGVLDVLRGQTLVRLGEEVDAHLAPLAFRAAIRAPLFGASPTEATQPVRDVDTIRSFLAGPGPVAIFDMPWLPLYLAFVFLLHPYLGFLATFGLLVLIALTALTEARMRRLSQSLIKSAGLRNSILDASTRNAEVLRAMGMGPRAAKRFDKAHALHLAAQTQASDIAGGMGGASKVFRLLLQSAVLGLGAYLVLQGEVTAGAIIAASIASARALAPVEQAIGQWKGFVAARQSHHRLQTNLAALPVPIDPLKLPDPIEQLAIENVSVAVPGTTKLVLSGISFELKAGQGLGVIGPSAAGKSTLARAIVGVWPLVRGVIRLDGAALDRWSEESIGRHVGYLPQDVELFGGTVADNIARFEEAPDSAAVIAAAKAADVHDMILKLPQAYDTQIGPGGTALSAGQRQRIALARALFNAPFLVVLDEPNSNLDSDGEAALTQAIKAVRERGGIAIVVAHRPSALIAVDTVAVMRGGQLVSIGPKDEVLNKVVQMPTAARESA
jgi:ATP-binding cassette subfamily C protein